MNTTLKQSRGMTIIQTMLLLLVAGIVGFFVVDALIDMRCADQPQTKLCADRHPASKK